MTHPITKRDRLALRLRAGGLTYLAIGRKLGVGETRASYIVHRAYRKIEAEDKRLRESDPVYIAKRRDANRRREQRKKQRRKEDERIREQWWEEERQKREKAEAARQAQAVIDAKLHAEAAEYRRAHGLPDSVSLCQNPDGSWRVWQRNPYEWLVEEQAGDHSILGT